MEFPGDLKYTKEHEWVKVSGDTAIVGITEFAQSELGDVVFVELPDIDSEVEQFGNLCVVESTKAASDVYSPIGGKISEINDKLENSPDLINKDSYEDGWLVKIVEFKVEELENLMDAEEYKSYIE
jgi:glycine cleavage system H protein